MKRRMRVFISACMMLLLCACGSYGLTETSTSNIKEMSFLRNDDQEIEVGNSTRESYLKVSLRDRDSFTPSDVVFTSDNPEIATIDYTHDALTTYLYYEITGVSPGETYVYAITQDGSVTSDKIKVTVVGDKNSVTAENDTDGRDNSDEEAKEKLTQSDITYVERDKLQKLFIDMPTFADRDEIAGYMAENELAVHWFNGNNNPTACNVGLNYDAVTPRGRDRKGPAIYIEFTVHDGLITRAGYVTDGSIGFFENFELTYEDGKFHYDGQDFEDGEAAMQLYLANNDIPTEEITDGTSGTEVDRSVVDISENGELTDEAEQANATDDNSNDEAKSERTDYNFDTYDNEEQQQTTDQWVLNTKSHKIHKPSCDSVPKIAPENYDTSNESIDALEAKGYSRCGNCLK